MEFLGFPPRTDTFPGIDVLGDGCRIDPGVSVFRPRAASSAALIRLGQGVVLFDRVRLLLGSSADLEIGDRTIVNIGSYLSGEGGLSIAEDVLIGPYARLLSAGHEIHGADAIVARNPITGAPIRVGRGAWIGAGATILQGRSIGEGAVVGAASVVTRDIDPWAVAVGNPARIVGYRSGHESSVAWWRRLLARLR